MLALRQIREIGFKVKIFAMPPSQAAESLRSEPVENLSVYYPHPARSSNPQYLTSQSAYRKLRPSALDVLPMYVAAGYDGYNLLSRLAQLCPKPSQACFQHELTALKEYPGANGAITFDSNGNLLSSRSIEIRKASDAGLEVVESS